MQLKTLLEAAASAKLSLTAVALTIGLSTGASAAPVQVDFSFSGVTGFFTFEDGIGDPTADAVSVTSFNSIDVGSPFWSVGSSEFEWEGDTVTPESYVFATGNELLFDLFMVIARRDDDSYAEIRCRGLLDPIPCPFVTLEGKVSFSTATNPVPLPAGLPMLIAGLGAIAGLRMREGRRTRIQLSNPAPKSN